MNTTFRKTVLALAIAGAFSAANATPLVLNVPTSSVDVVGAFFGGTLLASQTTSINNANYQGIARAAVYDVGTGLDFYYQFTNNATSSNGVERFTGSDFSSLNLTTINVFQTAAGFGIFTNGSHASDGADRTSLGVVGITFLADSGFKLNPGDTSYIQIVRTNARSYQAGNFGLLDGIGDNAVGFAPAASVPPTSVAEPAPLGMFMAGIGLIGLVRRRSKAAGFTV